MKKKVIIPTNETGHTIGERHHRALLTNRQIDLMLMLHEDWGFSYNKLSWIFGVKKHYVRDVCTYRRRSCSVMGHRVLWLPENPSEG
jgi:hypothetical protein